MEPLVSEAILQNIFGLVAGLLGAVVGGLFTLKATDKAIREENDKENRQEEKEVQNLLDAIGVEIGTLWRFHMQRVGERLEALAVGQPLEFYYPLTQNYFAIYDSNASKIGQVRDAKLREAVVLCYNKCKKAVDAFRYNNDLFREYRAIVLNAGVNGTRAVEKYNEMIECAAVLRADHAELKYYVEELLRLLAQRSRDE